MRDVIKIENSEIVKPPSFVLREVREIWALDNNPCFGDKSFQDRSFRFKYF